MKLNLFRQIEPTKTKAETVVSVQISPANMSQLFLQRSFSLPDCWDYDQTGTCDRFLLHFSAI